MKKALVIILLLGTFSCSNNNNSKSMSIVGKWKPTKETDAKGSNISLRDCEKETFIVFKSNGKLEVNQEKDTEECQHVTEFGEYSVENDTLLLKIIYKAESKEKEYLSKNKILRLNETTLVLSTFWSSADGNYPEKYITTNEYTKF